MALTKPILNNVVPFDATKQYTFLFNVVGGDQVVRNVLTIKNNATGALVYTSDKTTFKFENEIPKNILSNGVYYNASIVTYNSSGTASRPSNIIQFYCFSEPLIVPKNFVSGGIIDNQSFNFDFIYSQTQSEPLSSYSINLYNSSKLQIATSGIKFTNSSIAPLDVGYFFNGFENNTAYFIDISGLTLNGISVGTIKIPFTVQYIIPQSYSLVELTNNCEGGYITVKSNIQNISGESNPSPPIYVQNKEVDISKEGSWVKWDKGYSVSGDFTLRLWGRGFNKNSNILSQLNVSSYQNISLNYRHGYLPNGNTLMAYVDLVVKDSYSFENSAYYIYSNYIPIPLNTEQLFVWVRRVNGVYDIILKNRGVV